MNEGSRSWLKPFSITGVILFLAALLFWGSTLLDTTGRRKRVAEELQEAQRDFQRSVNVGAAKARIKRGAGSTYSFERTYAMGVVRELGPNADWALPELLDALQSPDPFVLREAARAAGSFGSKGTPLVPALIDLLNLEGRDAAWFAADSLGEMGIAASPAIPHLKVAAASSDSILRESATRSLQKLGEPKSPK